MKNLFLLLFVLLIATGSSEAQIFKRNTLKKTEKELFGKSRGNKKQAKVKEPRSVSKAKRKQEANQEKIHKEYLKSVKTTQKRSYEIQSSEVKARMRQNKKDIASRDKNKKRKTRSTTKKGRKKYK
jgi:hypothetical protein